LIGPVKGNENGFEICGQLFFSFFPILYTYIFEIYFGFLLFGFVNFEFEMRRRGEEEGREKGKGKTNRKK
jgi:hypothetical protein